MDAFKNWRDIYYAMLKPICDFKSFMYLPGFPVELIGYWKRFLLDKGNEMCHRDTVTVNIQSFLTYDVLSFLYLESNADCIYSSYVRNDWNCYVLNDFGSWCNSLIMQSKLPVSGYQIFVHVSV